MNVAQHNAAATVAELRAKAERAATTWPLVGIATYAQSPNDAYREAQDFGWGKRACLSVKFLSKIYFTHSQQAFVDTIEKYAPAIYGDICLCTCHHRLSDDNAYCNCCDTYSTGCFCHCHFCANCDIEANDCGGRDPCDCDCHNEVCCDDCEGSCWCQCHACVECDNPNGSCEGESDCGCICHEKCDDCSVRHAGGEDEEEMACCGCDCHTCSSCGGCTTSCGCNCHECCTDCANCECDCHDCDYCDDCSSDCNCDCHECCDECEEEAQADEDRKYYEIQANKIERVASRIKEVVGADFTIEETERIDGARLQAAAYPDKSIRITKELADKLNDDELAYIIGHEYAHIEKKHGEKKQASLDAKLTALKVGLKAKNRQQKESGAGFIKRATTQIVGGVLGGAAVVAITQAESRHLESEADERGLEIAEEAGYDPAAGASAYQKLHNGYVPDTGIVEDIISTHPAPRSRHKNLRDQAEKRKGK